MVSLLRNLMTNTLLITQLLMVTNTAALAMDTGSEPATQKTTSEQPFQPSPLGIPQRRLSGGTR